ncbi:MAG: septal ring lytic transglycosylase RlpA family protein, partial [Saprospiraceae bacterium]
MLRTICLLFFLAAVAAAPLTAQTVGDTEYGLAGYYSDSYQGSETAYGERYDKNELTAAHKLYPYRSRVRVTRADNNKSVVVRINDRGPFIQGRIIDLSRRAADVLGITGLEEVKVNIELLSMPGDDDLAAAAPTTYDQVATPQPAPAAPRNDADRQVATPPAAQVQV